ncbi:DegT/DnrJ/EryC1/StrS family aminotransferase [Muriicola marianensis]|uniref:8-amino-3,8-dideoxy-alpha-D-manno-octulosonate transaminase n=1 Tax=Muriicola marianensis TaxID=1324801 RepID=A0ABQ1QPU7_9FLAO|nr:DegT/DnrJ/EryC1/StrS family aminotransferase [Muriicola marianensis]GGD40137.1 8-amino-3,8-dideoxy-alpha-D-manno-octulosonate transaminase [Muriicola marianensis]
MPGFEMFGALERAEVQDVLDSGVLMRYGFDGMRNGHWKARELEQALASRMNTRFAQTVSSGTAALTVALASAGVGAGDEVIIPTFTFVASFEAVLALGAIPVLTDIDDTLCLDPAAVEKAITDRTKAVMPVHMCGSMADLKPLSAICKKHDLLLIEDACQAIGGSYEGKPLGSYGDVGCFSFDYVKTITCGEGGGLITDNETFYRNADHYSDHGHDHVGKDRGAESHPFLGYNFRISELNAAVGVAQIKRLDDFLRIQENHYHILEENLAGLKGITMRKVPETGVQNYSFMNFFLPSEALARKAQKALVAEGIDGCFYWYDNNWHYYRKWEHLTGLKSLGPVSRDVELRLSGLKNRTFPKSDHWMGRNLSCLVKLGWSREEAAQRGEKMKEVLSKILSSA